MLLILFIFVPIIEIYLLLKIGGKIGGASTLLIIILTAMLGAYLLKREGKSILAKLSLSLAQGKEPSWIILQGLSIFIGGLLLLTPGFVTDLLGFCFVIPFTRKFCINSLKSYFLKQGLVKSRFYSIKADGMSTTPDSMNTTPDTDTSVVDTTGIRIKSE